MPHTIVATNRPLGVVLAGGFASLNGQAEAFLSGECFPGGGSMRAALRADVAVGENGADFYFNIGEAF